MKKHILIVEDDEQLREAVKDVLHNAGYVTSTCTEYKNVLSCVNKSQVDLVLLDGYLNEFDGREVLCQLKNNSATRHIPVVFASVMSVNDLKDCKPDAILFKAYGMHELLAIVQQQLG